MSSESSSPSPSPRTYGIGTCYLCQTCLHCFKSCSYSPYTTSCKCSKERKQEIPLREKGKKIRRYPRVYDPNSRKLTLRQINEFKTKNNYYGYNIDFSVKFSTSLCSTCNSLFHRLGRDGNTQDKAQAVNTDQFLSLKIKQETNASEFENPSIFVNLPDNALELKNNLTREENSLNSIFGNDDANSELSKNEIEGIEINFKLIIKMENGKCNAAKWEKIMANDFQEFRSRLDRLIQEQFENVIFKEEYIVVYKREKDAGLGTQLNSENDWERFLKENERIISDKKVLVILVNMKRNQRITRSSYRNSNDQKVTVEKKNNKRKRSAQNLDTLDEPTLLDATNNNSNNTQNMQVSNPFYPPTGFFPMFFHPAMFNQYQFDYNNYSTNNLQQVQRTNNSISPPSIHEFFENLEEIYDDCNFGDVKKKFLREEIDVLDILFLKDYDWKNLGIKVGAKTKIMREVEKYRK